MSASPRSAADIQELVAREPSAPGRADWLHRLCRVAARTLPATGAGVSLMDGRGAQGLAAASDGTSQVMEELQFVLGEGPCLEAFRSRRPVLAPDIHAAISRWPSYVPAAQEQGVHAVFAFPLQIGKGCLGVLDVYRDAPGELPQSVVDEAQLYARVALMRLLNDQQALLMADPPGTFPDPLSYRLEVYQAQGMVQVQLGVDAEEALLRLRAYAFAHDRRISEVAQDVISRRLQLERDDEPPGSEP